MFRQASYKKLGIANASVYVSGNNLALIYSATKIWDPEVSGPGVYPAMKTFASRCKHRLLINLEIFKQYNMKKISNYIIAFAVLLFAATSCTDVLDQQPVNTFNQEVVFSDINIVKSYLGKCYDRMGGIQIHYMKR